MGDSSQMGIGLLEIENRVSTASQIYLEFVCPRFELSKRDQIRRCATANVSRFGIGRFGNLALVFARFKL